MSAQPLKVPVGIVGGGTWGVALSVAAVRAGAEVTLYTRRDPERLSRRVHTTADLAQIARAKLLVLAVPSTVVHDVVRALGDHLDGGHLVVHGVRGLGPASLETVSEIIRAETPVRRIGALGGPVQARELLDGLPSAMVCGSRYPEVVSAVTGAFRHPGLLVQGSPDLKGLEWASALVGCLSVGVGFADEAGAGPGLLAALVSRGVDEAARIATAAGAEERTLYGLGGYGDLLASLRLTDRPEVVLGRALARKRTLEQAVAEASLRVEAIGLIPRVAQFAKAAKVRAAIFDALAEALRGGRAEDLVERLFAE